MKILTRYLIFDRIEVACINNRPAQPAAIRSSARPVYKLQSSDPPPPPPVSRRHFVSDREDAQQYASTAQRTINTGARQCPLHGDMSC